MGVKSLWRPAFRLRTTRRGSVNYNMRMTLNKKLKSSPKKIDKDRLKLKRKKMKPNTITAKTKMIQTNNWRMEATKMVIFKVHYKKIEINNRMIENNNKMIKIYNKMVQAIEWRMKLKMNKIKKIKIMN